MAVSGARGSPFSFRLEPLEWPAPYSKYMQIISRKAVCPPSTEKVNAFMFYLAVLPVLQVRRVLE